MNKPDYLEEKSSVLLGRELLIVLVVTFSVLSFTLGYFVGKSSSDKPAGNPTQAAEVIPVPQKQETPASTQPAALAQPQKMPAADIKSTPQAEEAAKGPDEVRQKGPAETGADKRGPLKETQAAKEKTRNKPPAKQITKEKNKKPQVRDKAASEVGRKSDKPIYTVQMAAFKSASEANSFSKRYAKKGIKTYITTSVAKNKARIYKVKSGEFKDRKGADLMSLKLNKTEKLKTFVTIKSE